jgi:DNA-binding response OmpR family regulator
MMARVNESLTPNERTIVQSAGGVASVNKIFREAGGPIKVGEAAEVLKQFPKNQAVSMGLTTPKAANAVTQLGGPNKVGSAIVVYQKIDQAKKKRKVTKKKKKVTPAPAKPQIKVKLLKHMIGKFTKDELVRLAGENTLKTKNNTKDTLVKNFTKFIRKQPKKRRFSSTVKGKGSIKK